MKLKIPNQRLENDLENYKKFNLFLQEQFAELRTEVRHNSNTATQVIDAHTEKLAIKNQMEPQTVGVSIFHSVKNSIQFRIIRKKC